MIASLNQSSSPSSLVSALTSGRTFTASPSSETAEQQSRVLLLVDAQAHAAPFEKMPLAGDEVFDLFDAAADAGRPDLDLAEMEPELARRSFRQRHRNRYRVVAGDRFFDVADDFAVVDLGEVQVAGLQQCGIALPDAIEPRDVVLDVAGRVPVAHLELVFLRIEVLLLSRDWRVLKQLESVVDAVVARQGRRQRN